MDFEAMEFNGCKFEHCSFINSSLESVITRRCSFSECDFKSARLNASYHDGSAFVNCKFRYANFFGARFFECKLVGSDLADTNTGGMEITRGDWSYTSLRLNNLKGIDLRNVKLVKADLYRCNLEKANLQYADLSHAILAQANLCGADLREAITDGLDFRSFDLKGVIIDVGQAISVAQSFGAKVGEG